MFASSRWSRLLASTLALTFGTAASAAATDDVFVKEGVVVKPLSKSKQRRLERKLLKRPGNQVVIEGPAGAPPAPTLAGGVKTRRSFRPLFGDRFNKRSDVIAAPSAVSSSSSVVTHTPSTIVTRPGTIASNSRTAGPSGDPLVMPGSVEVTPTPRGVRPPVISTPRGAIPSAEPDDEPDLETERPGSVRVLPAPADEIPAPIVSLPRKASSSPKPAPTPEPTPARPAVPVPDATPPVDPGPPAATPPPAPEPAVEPTLELPAVPRPA